MFKQSPFYRTDIWAGRYCGHPLAAWTHLLAAMCMAAFLYLNPQAELGWVGPLFLLMPGCWLFMTGTMFAIRMLVKFVRRDLEPMFASGQPGLCGVLLNRESASFFMIILLLVLSFPHPRARTFHQEDFRQCIATLDPAAQAVLGQVAKPAMSRYEFSKACDIARKANAPRPASLQELQASTRG